MFWKHNALGVSWALLILVLCGLPGDQFQSSQQPNVDKVIHIILFGVLYVLVVVGFIKQRAYPYLRKKTLTKVFIATVVYGVLIEVLQATVFVGRSIEIFDMAFNVVGAFAGLAFVLWNLQLLVHMVTTKF
ncbi:MAG: VanZ family protein [Flavobacteriales bacterium]